MNVAQRLHGRPVQLAALVLLNLAVWGRTVGHEFVFDDLVNILQNEWISNWRALPAAFSHHAAGFRAEYSTSFYRPMMHVFYAVAYALAGPSPWAFHLLNVLLATASALGVYWLTDLLRRRWLGDQGYAWLPGATAALFSVHPVHVEAVAWVAGVTDLSYTLFGLLALIAYVRGLDGGPRPWPGLLLLASLLSKETGIAVLGLMVVVEGIERGRSAPWSRAAAVRRLALPCAALAVYLVLRLWALGGLAPSAAQHPHPAMSLAAMGAGLVARYLAVLWAPLQMNMMRAVPLDRGFADPVAVAGVAVLLALAMAWWRLRLLPLLALAIAVVVLPILPATYIPAIEGGKSVFGERYLYLPVLGVAWITALALEWWRTRAAGRTAAAVILAAVIVATGAVVSATRARVWRDSVTLWSHAATTSPDSAMAHEGLCHAFHAAGRAEAALSSCSRALALDAGRVDARVNRAGALLALGRPQEALGDLEAALVQRPAEPEAHTLRGLAMMALGRPGTAEASYRRAIAADPRYAEAHNDLGVLLVQRGRVAEGRAHLQEAVRLSPATPEYRANLAACPE